jgi:hypothetical protein
MFESKAQANPPSPFDERRAMAGQVKKRSPAAGGMSHIKRSVMHLSVIKSAQIPLSGATQLSDIRWGFETTANHNVVDQAYIFYKNR